MICSNSSQIAKKWLQNERCGVVYGVRSKYGTNEEDDRMKEPDKNVLYQIIYKVIDDYNITTGISFENGNLKNQLVEIIATMTEKSHRVYDDMVNNPDLAISIIDKAYAIARFYDSKFITVNHFIEAIEYCDRVYELTKNQAITKLNDLCNCSSKSSSKILLYHFLQVTPLLIKIAVYKLIFRQVIIYACIFLHKNFRQ